MLKQNKLTNHTLYALGWSVSDFKGTRMVRHSGGAPGVITNFILFPDKKIAIFEPHRFSRTKDCWNEFLHCFNDVDELYMCPIYPASEAPISGITSERLVEDINRLHPGLAKTIELKDLDKVIRSNNNSTIMTLGAGSIGRVIREWVLDNDRNE